MFKRHLQTSVITNEKSIFLLGPRQTGKSTLLHECFPGSLYFDLLSPALFRQLSARPEDLAKIVSQSPLRRQPIVIDKIQLLPSLLNVVHQLIESKEHLRFVLSIWFAWNLWLKKNT